MIESPDDAALDDLCRELHQRADALDSSGHWPAEQLRLCANAGVFRWFVPAEFGGAEWSEVDVLRGYLRLSAACLTTTFVITQRSGACRRIVESDNAAMRERWLPGLVDGSVFATVGISHLTTSRRHLAKPVLRAELRGDDFIFNGFSPWVTGGDAAEMIVTGGTLDDGRQLLAALPTDEPGIAAELPARLVGLGASHTGAVRCDRVRLSPEWVLAGPVENVMAQGKGAGTGGLQTSTLALGLARAAIDYLAGEATKRAELRGPAEALDADWQAALADLLSLASGVACCSTEELRARANGLALRTTQAALTAAKGSGYVVGHPAGRWCREALFFLVWSCPQPVMNATLCELAGLE
ncbi:MAG TPA: acyl-CoA dehydrogenase family protein [Pirellulales bacterium]|jgi:alkylation response protein AidB-like acyl-CoA dehydrogenase|nr:acyl-CoA dehydrogenase family protein [Pirellulales bacterium]